MNRYFHTFRRNTLVAQKLPENYFDKIQEFLSYNIKLQNKNSYKLYAMINIDETPIYLNMPASTAVKQFYKKK